MSVHGITIDETGRHARPRSAEEIDEAHAALKDRIRGRCGAATIGGTLSGLTPLPEDKAKYLPSPDDIAAGCAEIQAEWSAKVRAGRHVPPAAWTVPTVHYEGAE